MEDLRQRLHYPSRDVQLSAANKLYVEISKVNPASAIDGKTKAIPALQLVFDIIQEDSIEAVNLCCQVLIALVKNGLVEFRFGLNKILNFMTTAKHCSSLVSSVADLLRLQASFTESLPSGDSSPYSMRSPPHPFIAIYTSKPSLWPVILQQMSRCLTTTTDLNNWHQIWVMMKPFVKYILLNPESAGLSGHLKSALVAMVISISKGNDTKVETVMNFLVLECFPCLQLKTILDIQESLSFLEMATSFLLSNYSATYNHLIEAISADLLMVAHRLSVLGEGMLAALNLLKVIADHDTSLLSDITFLTVSCVLFGSHTPEEEKILLHLADVTLPRRPKLESAVIVLPILHILSTQRSPMTFDPSLLSFNQRTASRILSKLFESDRAKESNDDNKDPVSKTEIIMPQCASLKMLLQSMNQLSHPTAASDWLKSTRCILQMHTENSTEISPEVLMIASALFLESSENTDQALQTMLDMVERDNSKATAVLLLFLYKFSGREKLSAALTKRLMFAIPDLAHHRFTIAPILRVIKSMANTPAVAAVAMRLAVNLWKKQERCFPQLQEMISRTDKMSRGRSAVYDEYLFSRVATVRDICVARPHQHGAELIPTLSKILNDCTKPSEAPAAALAMDALRALSEAEVVDIRTIWIVLAPKIANDTRSKVQVSICNLLALVPELAVESEEYEVFREEVMTLLWERTLHSDPQVVNSAYSALAHFDREEFYLQDLPENVISKVKGQHTEVNDPEGEEEDESEEVPGSCYIDLMEMLPESASAGFQELLCSLITQELVTIPRHLNFTVTKKEEQSMSQMDRLVAGIPTIIYNKYESNKQPALKAPIAIAVLLTFEPKVDKSRDKHGKRHLLAQEQLYLNMMRILLNEIPISSLLEPSHLLVLPSVWTTFMGRVFQASVEAQKAQMGPTTTSSEDGTEPSDADLTAWLKARDKLCEQLRNVARDNSSANPNCLLALSGLTVVTIQYQLTLGQDSNRLAALAPEAVGHQRWIMMVVESLLTVLDKNYKTTERIIAWCQRGFGHQSKRQNTTLVAAVGLSQIAPVLIAVDTEMIQKVMAAIDPLVSKEEHSSENRETLSYSILPAVSMGMLLNQLTEEKYIEVVGDEALAKVVTSLSRLEKMAFAGDDVVHPGALLGLGVALAGMAADSSIHVGSQVKTVVAKLRKILKEGVDLSVVAQTLTLVTASGYHSNIIAVKDAEDIFMELLACSKEHTGLHRMVGVLGHCLCRAGHPTADDVTMVTVREWQGTLEKKDESASDRAAVIDGMLGFISGIGLLTNSLKPALEQQRMESAKLIQQLLMDSQDLRLQSTLLTGLGQFYFFQSSSSQVKGAVPSSYHYLPDESLLRSCVDFLHSAAQLGPEGIPGWQLQVISAALNGDGSNTLPPLNWAIIIGPLLRLPFGQQAQHSLMRLVLSQCPVSHNASLFLSSWISTSALYNSLERDTRQLVLVSLPVLAQHVPAPKLKSFLFTLTLPEVKKGCVWVSHSALRGLLGAVSMANPPQSTMSLLFEFTEKVYDSLTIQPWTEESPVFKLLANCLIHVPADVIDVVSHPAQEGNLIKSTLIRSYLVGSDQQSLAWLNACIDVGMNLSSEEDHARLIVGLSRGLLLCTQHIKSKLTGITARIQWLVELIGHCHNVASGKMKLKDGRPVSQATRFLLDLFCCMVGVWCTPQSPVLLGLSPFTMLEISKDEVPSLNDDSPGKGMDGPASHYTRDEAILKRCFDVLPDTVSKLLSGHPWNQVTQKVIQWLLSMHKLPAENLPSEYRPKIKAVCYALCQATEVKKPIWTTVYSWD